jgi:hypothetical protein
MVMTEDEKDARIAKLEAELHRMHRRHSEMAQYAAFWMDEYLRIVDAQQRADLAAG